MFKTLEDMISLNLNSVTVKEFNKLDITVDPVEYIEEYIENLRYDNGRKIRSERRQSMMDVLRILYSYLNLETGECSPSMRTIAYELNPELEQPAEGDCKKTLKMKEKALASTLMYVQRTIKALELFGFIKTHKYRAESNQEVIKNANFFYEIMPVSLFSQAFAALVYVCSKAMKKLFDIATTIGQTFAHLTKRVAKFEYRLLWKTEELII